MWKIKGRRSGVGDREKETTMYVYNVCGQERRDALQGRDAAGNVGDQGKEIQREYKDEETIMYTNMEMTGTGAVL